MRMETAEGRRALLERLAEWQKENREQYASVDYFVALLEADPEWVNRHFDILAHQGRVELLRSHTGASVRMTAVGWHSLEQPEGALVNQGQSTSFHVVNSPGANIANLQNSPAATVAQTSSSNLYEEFASTLDRLVDVIANDDRVTEEDKRDAAEDSDRLKTELKRAKPDRETVWKWFDRLAKIGGTAKLVETVTSHLGTVGDLLHKLLP